MRNALRGLTALLPFLVQGISLVEERSRLRRRKGHNVALAFHGAYMRKEGSEFGWRRQLKVQGSEVCSNFFLVEANIKENIIEPLENDGANISIYVDSFSRFDCLWRDQELIERLHPVRIKLGRQSDSPRVVDSYIRVLRTVLEDKNNIDYVILLRFDVKYSKPITSWNMTWDATNAAFIQAGRMAVMHQGFLADQGLQPADIGNVDDKENRNWNACAMVSDLLFTMPIHHAEPFIRALEWSGTNTTNTDHVGVGGIYQGKDVYCYHDLGAGHFVWQPFVQEMGAGSMRIMDYSRGLSSSNVGTDCHAFLCIERSCGDDYFDRCT